MKDQVVTPIKLIPPGKNEKSINTGKPGSINKREDNTKILLPPVEEEYIKARQHDFL